MNRRTASPQETEAVGAELARGLRPGTVVLIGGELGTGKTTFVRGACRELGVTEPVTSPTFTVGQRYQGGAGAVSHLDLHRLDGLGPEEPGLLDDYLTPDSISFVEWPGALEGDLGADALAEVRVGARVELRHAGGDAREVTIEVPE